MRWAGLNRCAWPPSRCCSASARQAHGSARLFAGRKLQHLVGELKIEAGKGQEVFSAPKSAQHCLSGSQKCQISLPAGLSPPVRCFQGSDGSWWGMASSLEAAGLSLPENPTSQQPVLCDVHNSSLSLSSASMVGSPCLAWGCMPTDKC